MCFYFGLPDNATAVMKRFKKSFQQPDLFVTNDKYNGFSHPTTAIITNENPDIISFGSWGLLPQWASDKSFRKNTLNARIETVDSLPSFKDNISNRCLIPASRFYDWRHEGKTKIPYIILSNESEIFSFAGLYSDWLQPETNTKLRTYTLLTTQANETMQYIHNTKQRMPVILHQKDEEKWLEGDEISKYAFPYNTSLVGFKME